MVHRHPRQRPRFHQSVRGRSCPTAARISLRRSRATSLVDAFLLADPQSGFSDAAPSTEPLGSPGSEFDHVANSSMEGARRGIFDSSRTRVAPVFGHLQCLDPSGKLWLQGLLELANSRKAQRPDAGAARLRVAKWWPREARLAAPPGLLRWLLENAEEPRDAAAWGRKPEVKENRRRVVDRDADTLAQALRSLQERRPSP